MVTVRYRLAAAARTVLMSGFVPAAAVLCRADIRIGLAEGDYVLIHVILMGMVQMAAVQVAHMAFMHDRRVSAAGAMLMIVVLVVGAHKTAGMRSFAVCSPDERSQPMTSPDTSSLLWLDLLITPAWVTDAAGRLVFANSALHQYSGLNRTSLEDNLAEVLHPEDRDDVLTSWQHSRDGGTTAAHQVRLRDQDGRFRWFRVQTQPCFPGRDDVWVALAHDIHALKQGEERATRMQDVTSALARARDVPGVLAVLPLCARVLDAPHVSVLKKVDHEMHLIGSYSDDGAALDPSQVVPADLSVPAADVLHDGQPLIVSREALRMTSPHPATSETLALFPMIVDGTPVGVLTLGFAEGTDLDAAEQRMMLTLAELLAQALERARLFDLERASRRRARAVLNAAPQKMWVSHPARTQVHFNRTWAEYTGLEELLERGAWSEVIHPGDPDVIQADQGQATEPSRTREVRLRRYDGTYRWHEVSLHPLEGNEWLGIAIDVHDRREAERALHQNAERIQLALAAGAILGTWFWDLPTDRFTVDEGFALNFGLDPAVGRTGLSLEQVIATVHADDRDGLIAAIGEAIARGGPYAHQYRVRRRDGHYYWIEANGRVDTAEDGTPLSFPGVLLDVEESRTILEALRASEVRFQELADHVNQFVWTADASGAITWCNQRWYDYTGTAFEEMQGWGWRKVHHPHHVERVTASFRQAVEAGEPWEDTFPLRSRNGEYRWFLSYALPIRDEAGQVLRWFGTNTDVTEQREAETQLRDLNTSLEARVAARTADLRAAVEEMGAFAYTVSHDLRTPVRHVGSFAGVLRRKIGDNPGLLRYVDQIEEAARRMELLTDALLGLARSGMTELNKTDVDLGSLVHAVHTDLAPDLAGRNVTWQISTLPVVQADEGLLRQVLTNLLGNAVKYSRECDEAMIEVWAEGTPDEVIVAVRDNGVGFDPSHAARLFGVFQRLHHQHEFEGIGVGLANVKRVIEKHGGRVWASARPGEGATFFFSLPQG